MSDQVTIIDVAREAGVSYATVSRVINNEEYVKPATRQRVQEVLARMGYVGNRQARSLRGGRSHTIGVLAREISTSYTPFPSMFFTMQRYFIEGIMAGALKG